MIEGKMKKCKIKEFFQKRHTFFNLLKKKQCHIIETCTDQYNVEKIQNKQFQRREEKQCTY